MLGNLPSSVAHVRYAGDICKPLIDVYKMVQTDPLRLLAEYKQRYGCINADYDNNVVMTMEMGILPQFFGVTDPTMKTHKSAKDYFKYIRDKFNKEQLAEDFFFLCRVSHNGLVRFNSKGDFNASLGVTPDGRPYGVSPERLYKILAQWNVVLQGVNFYNLSYQHLVHYAGKGDFVYLDPPYPTDNFVYGANKFNYDELADTLNKLTQHNVNWMCSFGGNNSIEFEKLANVSDNFITVSSGPSSYKKFHGIKGTEVTEYILRNYK